MRPLALAAALVTQNLVDRNTMDPGPERTLSPKFRQFMPCADECFLDTIVRHRRLTGHPQAKRVNPADMLSVKHFERGLFSFLGTNHKILFRLS